MKTFFLILSGLLIACPVWAQRAIVLSDLPFSTTPRVDVMRETNTSYADQIENEARKTGSNVMWDFSDAPASGEIYRDTTKFIEASRTPYFDLFPTATLAEEIDDSFEYYLVNEERIESLGSVSPTIVSRNNGLIFFTLPFGFEQRIDNSFTTISTYLETQEQDTMTGRIQVDYLGYGTVRLPQGSIPDVAQLRFRFTYEYPIIGRIDVERYEFISLTDRKLVAVFETDMEGGRSFDYMVPQPTARKVVDQPVLLALSPNPTNGRFNLTYIQRETSPLTIEVVDLLGRTVLSQTQAGSVGLQQLQLDLDAPAGVYTVVVRSASGSTAQKLILN